MNMISTAIDLSEDFSENYIYLGIGSRPEDVKQLKTRTNAEIFVSMFILKSQFLDPFRES